MCKTLNASTLGQIDSASVPFCWYLLGPKDLLQLFVHLPGLEYLSVEPTKDSRLWFDLYSVRWSCS